MKFRNLTIPKLNRPATVPFLAHSDFSAQVSRFLRNHVLKYKEIAIPLRLPTSKLREAAAQTLSGFLEVWAQAPCTGSDPVDVFVLSIDCRNFGRFGMNNCSTGLNFTVVLRSPMKISKPNFFDSGPLTPRSLHDNPGFSFQNIERLLQWYVDDGFILFDHRFRSALPMQVLSDCFFYQAPMELETVQDGTLLGFTIDVVQRTVRYQVPPLWKIRDLRSAGSVRLRLSGLKSRATLIRRYTFLEQFVLWRSRPTHSAVCTERVLQNGLPTRLVQKAVRAYLNFWLWKVATDMLMRLQMFQCGFLQITCWCLASTQLKEHKPGYVPFCVCQALY